MPDEFTNCFWRKNMKLLKLTAVLAATAISSTAMANMVTNAGNAVVSGITTTGKTAFDSTKTVVKTFSKPASISAEISTFGYGANIAWSANETAEVVAGWTGGSFDAEADIGGNDSIINWKKVLGDEYKDYSGTLKLDADFSNPYVGVKVRPFANRFTVSTGMIFTDNSFDATLRPHAGNTSSVKIDGDKYDVTGDIVVKAESGRKVSPYLTVGFKPNSDRRFGMFGEIGAAYTGKWKTDVQVNGTVSGAGTDNQELANRLQEKISSDNPEWYPIVKLGATMRF